MSVQFLSLGEKKAIIETYSRPGPKTLFVNAIQNWPAPTGQVEPSIPLDINIGIEQSSGDSIVALDIVQLPNVGYSDTFLCDQLNVWVEYTTAQGLVTPYTQYLIASSIIPGRINKNKSVFTNKFAQNANPVAPTAWPSTGSYIIPNFSSEFRTRGNAYGVIIIEERTNVGAGTQWAQQYDLAECLEWQPLSPLSYQWTAAIWANPYAVARSDLTVEFR